MGFSFFASVLTGGRPDGEHRNIHILVRRPYLADVLRKGFEGYKDIEVLVDRRAAERRTTEQPVAVERRQVERRKPKKEKFEVVIEIISLPHESQSQS